MINFLEKQTMNIGFNKQWILNREYGTPPLVRFYLSANPFVCFYVWILSISGLKGQLPTKSIKRIGRRCEKTMVPTARHPTCGASFLPCEQKDPRGRTGWLVKVYSFLPGHHPLFLFLSSTLLFLHPGFGAFPFFWVYTPFSSNILINNIETAYGTNNYYYNYNIPKEKNT